MGHAVVQIRPGRQQVVVCSMSKFVTGNDQQDDDSWQRAHANDPVLKVEPVDNRSLFEKLQEQKAAKEDALNEATKFSNLIRRLDNDEVDFLAGVNEQKARENAVRQREHEAALERFRTAQRAVDDVQNVIAVDRSSSEQADTGSFDRLNKQESSTSKRTKLSVTGIVKKDRKRVKLENSDSPTTTSTMTKEEPKVMAALTSDVPVKRSTLINYDSSSDVE